jgi:hypothetical protein
VTAPNPVAGQAPGRSRPWWFVLVRLWVTLPVLAVLVGVGYAVGHLAIGAVFALTCLVAGFAFSRWARARRRRVLVRLKDEPGYRRAYNERSDRLARIFGWYFVGAWALLVLAVIALVVAKLA